MSICLIRWRLFSVESRSFALLLGFLLVLEAAFGFLEAHAGVHLKKVLEIIWYSVSVSEALFFGNISGQAEFSVHLLKPGD